MWTLPIFLLALTTAMADEVAVQEFTNGNNLFTAAVYKEILKDNTGNILVSPFSAETVLALTQSGAKDETANEIRSSLYLPNSTERTEAAYKALLPTLKGNSEYALHTANKVYVKNSYPLKEPFKKVATEVYHAGLENIDFAQKAEAAETINSWVEKQTENKIQNLIDPTSLDESTRVILVNALYFKGKWVYPFEGYATVKKSFYKSPQEVVEVDTMHNTDQYNYYESPELNAKFLELPYQGGDVSMVIVLPNAKDGLPALESQIEKVFSAPKWSPEQVSVALPKFTIDAKIKFQKILENLGMKRAFTDDADLSGIGGNKGDLVISDVIQKAFINVTETGTEAAAATAVIGVTLSLDVPVKQEPKPFIADHPFIFYIRAKNIVLFGGRILIPK